VTEALAERWLNGAGLDGHRSAALSGLSVISEWFPEFRWRFTPGFTSAAPTVLSNMVR
jgi:hypothetical protein